MKSLTPRSCHICTVENYHFTHPQPSPIYFLLTELVIVKPLVIFSTPDNETYGVAAFNSRRDGNAVQ